METTTRPDPTTRGVAAIGIAVLALAAAWMIPARVRSLHPEVLVIAARGTPGLLEAVTDAVRRDQPGAARWFARAAGEVGGVEAGRMASVAAGGGAARLDFDAALAPTISKGLPSTATNVPAAFDWILPEAGRQATATFLAGSRSPGTQALLRPP